ncbi:hypothetical protein [Nocardioides convexus]|uniref:hypothetical protein n=1 Tax=Nocardioides convexus TaxID=2712224 RepID=UPI002418250C|nr:hypothetical protein [Nocardioides convexus]
MHAGRLGHGVRAAEDPDLLRRIVDAGVALEVCPVSNVALGVYSDLTSVPLPTLLDAGATVALGADDPLLFGSRLAGQYATMRAAHELLRRPDSPSRRGCRCGPAGRRRTCASGRWATSMPGSPLPPTPQPAEFRGGRGVARCAHERPAAPHPAVGGRADPAGVPRL